jgi:general stress protein 26
MKSTDELYDFLNRHKLAVISTVNSKELPQSAIIGFGQTKDLAILFGTDNSSRKYMNLGHNPHVSLAVGGDTAETIQYEGIARELKDEELDLIKKNYWQKNPHAAAHHKNPGERYFIVQPTWIRYTDLRIEPWDITEIKF